MKEHVVIIFPTEWVAYSPTILNLVEALCRDCQVLVVAFDNGKYNNQGLDPDIFKLIRIPAWLFKVMAAFGIYRIVKSLLFRQFLRRTPARIVIGVDGIGLYVAQRVYGKSHFLSLEIEHDCYFRCADPQKIISVAIQTKERLNYLFPDGIKVPFFLLPNSPVFEKLPEENTEYKIVEFNDRNIKAIFMGNIIPQHGLLICIDAIATTSNIILTMKGIISQKIRKLLQERYAILFKQCRLVVDDSYTPQKNILDYLRQFDVGFCFYDFDLITQNNFNYISSPSGKMYNYFAAGVPVIGSEIIGLCAVRNFDAGILLSDLSPQSILDAIDQVKVNHERFKQGCLRAASTLDFAINVKSYKDFLLGSPDTTLP